MFLLCCMVAVKSNVYSQTYGLNKYGFIIGNDCGQIIDTEFSNGHLSIHIAFPERKTLCGKLEGNVLTGAFEGQSFMMTFEAGGTGHGRLHDGRELLMIEGEKATNAGYQKLLERKGVSNSFHRFIADQRIQLNDAIAVYCLVKSDRILITLIYDGIGKDGSSQVEGKRVAILQYSQGTWEVEFIDHVK